MSIDLHIHTTYSDGTYSPAEIVTLAKEKGLEAISITDHDTARGTCEAVQMGDSLGIEVIPGIELSSEFEGKDLHILGYFIEPSSDTLARYLQILQNARIERNKKIIEKLQILGIPIEYSEVVNVLAQGQTGRPHIGRALIIKGIVKSMDQAFSRYLGKNGAAYVSRFVYDTGSAIKIIKECGGMPVLAHPVQLGLTESALQILVSKLVDMGLQGIETYYPTQSKSFIKKLRRITEHFDLVVTGGSDYHGLIRPGTSLAGGVSCFVPHEVLEQLKTYRNRLSV